MIEITICAHTFDFRARQYYKMYQLGTRSVNFYRIITHVNTQQMYSIGPWTTWTRP